MKKMKVTVTNKDNATNGAPAPAVECKPDEFKLIPRAEIFPDPDQPRKTFDEVKLKELADSIAAQGIVQPLIVRAEQATHKILEPDLHDNYHRLVAIKTDADTPPAFRGDLDACRDFAAEAGFKLQDRFVIVAGERRWRAAEIAGLATVPCLIRDMDERRKFAQQIIENNQREGVSAIEGARALDAEYSRRRAAEPTLKKEDFAREIGMSRADFYGTLVLTRLHKPVEEALLAGKISASQAKELAKLPRPHDQTELLKKITDEKRYNYPFSVRDVQDMVDNAMKQLKDAPFDTKLTYGDSNDLLRPCTKCEHRTGNMVDDFPELAQRPNICTNPLCYAAKCREHFKHEALEMTKKGGLVLTEPEFKKVRANYTPAESYIYPVGKNGPLETLLGRHAPAPLVVATDDGLEKYYAKADLPEAYKAAKIKFRQDDTPPGPELTPEQKAEAEAKAKAEREAGERRAAFVPTLLPRLGKCLEKLSQAKSWEVAELLQKHATGYALPDVRNKLAKSEKDSRLVVLANLFADEECQLLDYSNDWSQEVVDAWKMTGIDPVKEFEVSEKDAQPSMTLPKSAPKQQSLVDVKPGKKKLSADKRAAIVAAEKARWAKIKAAN